MNRAERGGRSPNGDHWFVDNTAARTWRFTVTPDGTRVELGPAPV